MLFVHVDEFSMFFCTFVHIRLKCRFKDMQFFLHSAGGHCGSSLQRALPICRQTADGRRHSSCVIRLGPVLYFPECVCRTVMQDGAPQNKARRRETGDRGTRSGGGRKTQPHCQLTCRRQTRGSSRLVLLHHDYSANTDLG